MIKNLEGILSTNARDMKRSVIRELLKLTQKPDVISFAGGLPSPESFPVEAVAEICQEVMAEAGRTVLQYGATEGYPPLKKEIIKHVHRLDPNAKIDDENLLITTASQQGLDLVGKVFINRGDKVMVALPSYLGGLNAFRTYGAKMIGVPLDDHGMRIDLLRQRLTELKNIGEKPKFIYVIPDFQNPAGVTMSVERRKQLLETSYEFDVLIIEDSPYREIRFEGEMPESIYSMDRGRGNVLQLGTFSKTFAPGFRIGWTIAHPELLDKMVKAKQSMDLCTPTFTQAIAAKYLEKGLLEEGVKKNIEMYREKLQKMLECLEKYMPKHDDLTWTKPEGGLFLWVRVPHHINLDDLIVESVEEDKVAYVIGSAFHCDGSGQSTMRLNFSYPSLEQIEEGVKRLAKLLKSKI